MQTITDPAQPKPPRLDQVPPRNRIRWLIHFAIVTAYILAVTAMGLGRHRQHQPALSHTTGGLLIVCGRELAFFGVVLGVACLSSRAPTDDLRLQWRGGIFPVLLGAAYSVGLRIGLAVVLGMVCVAMLAA